MSKDLNIGQVIDRPQHKDAIHMAVAPVIASEDFCPGTHVGVTKDGYATQHWPNAIGTKAIGVVDPFLMTNVKAGQQFWLLLYPGSITSLHHEWSHPAFDIKPEPEIVPDPNVELEPTVTRISRNAGRPKTKGPTQAELDAKEREVSVLWMTAWAREHVGDDYYSDGQRTAEDALAFAIEAGRNQHIGPYENARDFIDDEWWNHWEKITGGKASRGEYFSCAC